MTAVVRALSSHGGDALHPAHVRALATPELCPRRTDALPATTSFCPRFITLPFNSPDLPAEPPSPRTATLLPFAHSATGHPHFAAEGFVQRRASPPDPAASTQRSLPSRAPSAMKRSELPVAARNFTGPAERVTPL